jgi:endonuclease/exonuclease/phosphatase family metal-dependent hydrolase
VYLFLIYLFHHPVTHTLTHTHTNTQVVEEIKRIGADIVGLEEVDRVEDLRTKLRHTHTHTHTYTQEEEKEGLPSLELAVYKHRKTCPEDDGCALFYDPRVVRVYQSEGGGEGGGGGGPAVACVRFSGEAEVKQQQHTHTQVQEPVELPLYHSKLPIKDGVVKCIEEVEVTDTHTHTHKIDLWSFTPPHTLRRSHQELWDERVAVVALFEHLATGDLILAACTHLAHSQDKPQAEAVRAAQVRQLDRALGEIERKWLDGVGVGGGGEKGGEGGGGGSRRISVARVVMMDGNDPPRLADLGVHRCVGGGGGGDGGGSSSSSFPVPPSDASSRSPSPYTPFYHTMTQDLGYLDLLGEDYGPTSITLHRRLRLDYIWIKPPPAKEEEGIKIAKVDFVPALTVRLAGVDEKGQKILLEKGEEEKAAVYGLPLPEIDGEQACVPSDHLHTSVKVTFGE